MIAVDTNVVIRLLTHDDEKQYQKAFEIFKQNEVFIADTVILETEWVLRYAYKFSTNEICEAFKKLFGLRMFIYPTRIKLHRQLHGINKEWIFQTRCI